MFADVHRRRSEAVWHFCGSWRTRADFGKRQPRWHHELLHPVPAGTSRVLARPRASPPSARPPVVPDRRQVGSSWVRGHGCLAVVLVEPAPVLIGQAPPAPVRRWPVRHFPERLVRIDALVTDRAQVGPVVAEVEGVGELLAECQPGQFRPVGARDRLALRRVVPGISWSDEQCLVGEFDRVQVRQVPATEGIVDGRGELARRSWPGPRRRSGPVAARGPHHGRPPGRPARTARYEASINPPCQASRHRRARDPLRRQGTERVWPAWRCRCPSGCSPVAARRW